MVRIAKIVAIGPDDVVVVSAGPHPSFTPSRVGRFFVRLLAPRDVLDLIEERSIGEYSIIVTAPAEKKPRRTRKPTIAGVAVDPNRAIR